MDGVYSELWIFDIWKQMLKKDFKYINFFSQFLLVLRMVLWRNYDLIMSCIIGLMSLVILNFNISIQRYVGISFLEEKLLFEGNFFYFGDYVINIQSRICEKVNYKFKVKRLSLVESIGLIVVL